MRTALDALMLKQDGTAAAENTVNRKRTVFSNCLRYAVERELLTTLPLDKVDWTAPETDDEIDFRFVPGSKLARAFIDAVGEQGERGRHLMAFFGCLYYAANRPGETASLRENDFTLTEEGWGEVLFLHEHVRSRLRMDPHGRVVRYVRPEEAGPQGAAAGTDSAGSRAPGPQAHPGVRYGRGRPAVSCGPGGHLLSKECGEVRKAARLAALSESEAASPLADVPYSLRHMGVSLWLEPGDSPAEFARRAGHSIAVLFRFYAKAIHRNQQRANQQIERALEAADEN
ncbi:hypothetical protein ACFWP5_20215 [Streptomyces sp. NPDC058469]|uniref:hypothetical protein n=1 Tax=Streptomyces sp. NPDC058469 TaxID=3346514 RepID=UPI00364A02FA